MLARATISAAVIVAALGFSATADADSGKGKKTKSTQQQQQQQQDEMQKEVEAQKSKPQTGTTTTTAAALPPDRPLVETTPPVNQALLWGGAGLFVASYAASFVVALGNRSEDNYLFIPVAGPWIDLGARDCDRRPCTNETLNVALLIADGLAQAAGLIGVGAAFLLPRRGTTGTAKAEEPSITIAPTRMARDGYGLMAIGRF
jgi:hypothetical protein